MFFNNQIKKLIDSCEIVSFDIFDTAILRPYIHPNDMFNHIEQIYNKFGFATARINAEKKAWEKYRNNGKEDTTIIEIYNEINKNFSEMKKNEENFEVKIAIQNPEIFEVYQYAKKQNKTIVFISDIYLPKKILSNMLIKTGYIFDKLYVSSEYGKLKQTSSLFNVLINDFKISPKNILHIGDNILSDFQKAKEVGIKSIHYKSILKQFIDKNKKIENIVQEKYDIATSVSVMLSAIHWKKQKLANTYNYWIEFGYFYNGIACLGFLQWIKQNLKTDVKDILFVARDGWTLQKIFNKLYKYYNTHYIYAPRSLNLLCRLNYEKSGRFAYEHTKTLIEYYRNKDKKLADAPHIQSGEEGVHYIDKHIKTFQELAKVEKENYIAYLKSQNIKSKNVALVDTVSMFFSAQKFLEELMPENKFYGYYYLIQTGAKENNNTFTFKEKSYYAPDLSLIEFMMTSPEPPILNIKNNKPVYKKDITKEELDREKICEFMSNGALEFADEFLSIFTIEEVVFTIQTITKIIMNLIEKPTEIDKENFLNALCAYDPEHKDFRPIFPEWYNKKLQKRNKTNLIEEKVRIICLPFLLKKYQKRDVFYSNVYFCNILLIQRKFKWDTSWYKLFGLIPILKIRICNE